MHPGRRWKNAWMVVLLALPSLPAFAGTTQSFTYSAGTYAGSRDRQYKVYVPDGLSAPASMVMVLHGCQQTNDDVLNDWGMTAAADRYGFILVAPFITSYDGLRNTNCWGFWLGQHRHEGGGEPEDLHRIGLEVEARFNIDPARRYITGLSSGGAMTAVAAITHNEYWAAAASAAGLPYGEDAASVSQSGCPGFASFHPVDRVASDMRSELNDSYPIPLMVLQNTQDCTVLEQAAFNLRDAQLRVFGTADRDTPAEAQAAQAACTPVNGEDYSCQRTYYTVDGTAASRSLVETVLYTGPHATPNTSDTDHGHYWIGGAQGRNGNWALKDGPSYPDIIWDFFSRHPRGGSAPPADGPRITINGANPLELTVGESFADPGASATDPEDGDLAVTTDCSGVDTSRVGDYTCTYSATDSDGHTVTASRRVTVKRGTPDQSCAEVNATPAGHILAGRAIAGGSFYLRALATGDGQDIGFAWDFWSSVALHEGSPGEWFAAKPAACP